MTKPLIFISHITEENAFALMIKKLIDAAYFNSFETFVSSDVSGILPGSPWIEEINKALKRCSLMISLCSPVSVVRPWINYEAGAAWGLGKKVIPLLHSGLKIETLKAPLSQFQALDISRDDFIPRLFKSISDINHIGIPSYSVGSFYNSYNEWSVEYTFLSKIKNNINELIEMYYELKNCFIRGDKEIKISIDDVHGANLDKLLKPLKKEGFLDYYISLDRLVMGDEKGEVFKSVSISLTQAYYDQILPHLKQ